MPTLPIPLVVDELRRLAQLRAGDTLQPTALVNEPYLRLVNDQARDGQNPAHFIGVSISFMRRILIGHARRKRSLKRGSIGSIADYAGLSYQQADELLSLNIALDELQKVNPRQCQIVAMRYLGGLSAEEAAELLKISPIKVKRDWVIARALFNDRLRPGFAANNFA
jgi:RNA polymerase sigma-70 factor (ECF subfamily)